MQVAFRVKTDAAILGAGIVIAGGADTYPAPPTTSRHHPKLAAFFHHRHEMQPAVRLHGATPWIFRCFMNNELTRKPLLPETG